MRQIKHNGKGNVDKCFIDQLLFMCADLLLLTYISQLKLGKKLISTNS